jgi:hypothetical protein
LPGTRIRHNQHASDARTLARRSGRARVREGTLPSIVSKSNEDHETVGSLSQRAESRATVVPGSYGGGRYVVKRLLGEGGQKRVYLASDTRLERDVVIAVLKFADFDEETLARFEREARTLARLGDHPNIVSVFDIGEEEGHPYIVAQFVDGGSLDALRKSAPGRRLPVGEALRIGQQICQALQYAHQQGVVHRDLKPGNIWFTRDGTIKLGDFGLAVGLNLSRLSLEGMLLGTVSYMAPEQALGQFADPRSDVYALGVTLYELLAGRLPFVGDTLPAIISQHLHAAPVAPSWHVPGIPPALDSLILRMLAKTPADRPASAEEVGRALTSILSSAGDLAAEDQPSVWPLDRLAAGVFVGRASELKKLRAGFDDALAGRPQILLLTGEPGSGKTATAEQLLTYAHVRGAEVLRAQCHEGEGAPAYWPWVQLLRGYVARRSPEQLVSVMGTGAAAIAQLDADIQQHLPELSGIPSLEPEPARFRLFDGVTTFFKNASGSRPIVVLLDDIHWADTPSLLLLQFLAKELRAARMLVIATYRNLVFNRKHPLMRTLGALAGQALDRRIELSGLSEADVARFIEMTIGAQAPQRLVSTVYRETEGNPFFVKEVVRLLAATGQLDRVEQSSSWTITLPDGVREVVIGRLAQLSDSCHHLLEIASVMGREFEANVLEQAGELDRAPVADSLGEATAARLVTASAGMHGRYRFSHALIRETLYEGLTAVRRAQLHLQIGQALERIHGEASDAHFAALAHHFFQAISLGQADKAITYAVRAGRRADRLLAYEEAVSQYEGALRALDLSGRPDDGRRCELLLTLGDAQTKAGLSDSARETFGQAAAWARQHGPVEQLARAALGLGAGTAARTRLGSAIDDFQIGLLREALARSSEVALPIRARLLAQLSLALYHSPAERTALSEQAVALARRADNSAAELAALYSRCIALEGFNDAQERLALATEIVQVAERAGDTEMALRGHYRCLRERLELADLPGVEQELVTYANLANELRQPRYLWYVPLCRASLACFRGRLSESESLTAEALAIGQRAQDSNATLFCVVLRNAVLWLQGRFDESEVLLNSLVRKYPVIHSWRAQLARLYCFVGRIENARREFTKLARHDFDDLPIDGAYVSILSQLCTVSWFLSDKPHAEKLYRLLEPYGERNIVAGNTAISGGAVSFGLGMAAAANSWWDEAERRFRHAIDLNTRMEAWPWLVLTECGYAWMVVSRGQPGDRERAGELFEHVQTLSSELDMSWVSKWFPPLS